MARRISFSVPDQVFEEIVQTHRQDFGEICTEEVAIANILNDSMIGEAYDDLEIKDLGHVHKIDHMQDVDPSSHKEFADDPPEEEEEVEEEDDYEDDDDEEDEDEEDTGGGEGNA